MQEREETIDQGEAGEAAADLKALQRMANADPGAQPDPEEVAAEQARPALDQEIAGALMMLAKMAGPMFPSVAEVYTDETCAAVGAAVAPVCDKYGWLQGGIGGEYGPEIMCLVVVGPMAYATYAAVQKDLEAKAAEKRRRAAERGQVPQVAAPRPKDPPGTLQTPGSDTVSFGAPVPA